MRAPAAKRKRNAHAMKENHHQGQEEGAAAAAAGGRRRRTFKAKAVNEVDAGGGGRGDGVVKQNTGGPCGLVG